MTPYSRDTPPKPVPRESQDEPLILDLLKLVKDRGRASELRRYWSPTTRYSYAVPVLGQLHILDKPADQIAAALFAEHCRQAVLHHPGGANIGAALRQLAGGRSDAPAFDSTERHVRRLLASDTLEEVGEQLHRLIRRLQRMSIPLDHNKLLWDLRRWSKHSDDVKTHWALRFWQAPAELAPTPQS